VSRLAVTLLVIALAGCESTKRFCDDHPVACPVLIGTLTTSLLLCAPEINHRRAPRQPDVSTPSVNCANGACR
jgi:hypothetical protein